MAAGRVKDVHLAAILGRTWLLGFAVRQTFGRRPERRTPDLDSARMKASARADLSAAVVAGDHGLYKRIPAWERWERDQSSRWVVGQSEIK